ncbi:MAG: geranylgeranylglyceryl/heptaprenylglyceryl phosphate synthase [Cyclobacteriaceae bacterium]
MMKTTILNKLTNGRKALAVLIDPDKVENPAELGSLLRMASECYIEFIFVGGSHLMRNNLTDVIEEIKLSTDIPVVLFPGSTMQIDKNADAILFLSLISGRNPELLIGQHVVAAPILKNSGLEVLPTGYMLISNERNSSVAYMSNTSPIPTDKHSVAASTAMAGEMLGLKAIYMDAGSGASEVIPPRMISAVRKNINIPLIVGGGINTIEKARKALDSGADVLVIGNAIEKNPDLMIGVSELIYANNQALNVH